MGKFESTTIDEFIGKMIQHLIETHDPSEDGESTGGVISLYQQLKDRVDKGIPYSYKRAKHVAEAMIEVGGDHGEADDMGRLEELAEEINSWD